MNALSELERLLNEKLVGTKADHILAERLISSLREQLNAKQNDTSKS